MRTLIDLISDGLTNIFDIENLNDMFSKVHVTNDDVWDMFRRRNKTKYVNLWDDTETNILNIENELKNVVMYITNTNFYKYQTLLNTVDLDYNPIENYRMVETTDSETTGSATTTGSNTTETTTAETIATSNDVYTFENVEKTTDETDGTTTASTTATDENTTNGNTTTNVSQTLTRSGNIGVTTSQQMIESERNLANFNFIANVFLVDIANELLLSIY